MGHKWKAAALLGAMAVVIFAAGQWQLVPPLASPVIPPTASRRVTSTATETPTLTPTITQTPTPGPSPTPDTRETSAAVFATITALAATPTYPPTSTPRPQRTPIGAGPEGTEVPPTALFTSGGIAVQTLSEQVFPGGSAALTIKTKPGAVCTLRVVRTVGSVSQSQPIPGTATRVAGNDGVVAWIWTVDASEPTGIMRLVADCNAAGKAQLQIKVTR